jgi:hypothetical protein
MIRSPTPPLISHLDVSSPQTLAAAEYMLMFFSFSAYYSTFNEREK